jgi:hypothetical protein
VLDRLGARLENLIDSAEISAADRRIGPALVGVGLAIVVFAAGIGAFIAVFAVLVDVFA